MNINFYNLLYLSTGSRKTRMIFSFGRTRCIKKGRTYLGSRRPWFPGKFLQSQLSKAMSTDPSPWKQNHKVHNGCFITIMLHIKYQVIKLRPFEHLTYFSLLRFLLVFKNLVIYNSIKGRAIEVFIDYNIHASIKTACL